MAGKEANERGANLERRVGRLEFADGALVRLRWPVTHQVAGRRRVITDVDVLSIDFDARLRASVSIIECKSMRGQSGEQDRLLWLGGLKTVLEASRAVLVRESITAAGRDLSRRMNVDLLGGRELERREADQQWLPEDFALIGNGAGTAATARAADQLKKIGDLPSGLTSFVRHDALLSEPHQILGALTSLFDITRVGTVLPEPAGRVVAADAFSALLLAALKAGGRLDSIGSEGLRQEIEDGLTTGDPHDRQVLKVVELADLLLREQLMRVHRSYIDSGARPQELKYPSLRDVVASAPKWLARFLDLADRCRNRAAVARQLPQTADLALYDALVGGTAWKAAAFDHLFTPQHRQLMLVCLDVLSSAAPQLAERLDDLRTLPFDRVPAAVPDRHAAPSDTSSRRRSNPGDTVSFTQGSLMPDERLDDKS